LATAQIAYETSTGRILLIHRFEGEPKDPQSTRYDAASLTDVAEDAITVMAFLAEEIDSEHRYRVDSSQNTIVEATAGQGGVGFGVRETRPPS
jgi:hypothetical protein